MQSAKSRVNDYSFATEVGGPIGLEELRRGVQPQFVPLPEHGADSYPDHPYYDWVFTETKTASWTRSAIRRDAYAVLRVVMRERVDCLRLHPLLEWPQLLLCLPLTAFAVVILGAWHFCNG